MKIDKLIRSKRKTIAILVHQDGLVTVRAPQRASLAQIQAFVDSKADWIREKQELARQKREALPAPKRFQHGETFLFLGKAYPLAIHEKAKRPLVLEANRFVLQSSLNGAAREVFTRWYQGQARLHITLRVEALAARFNLEYKKIRISSARTRWGSCSSSGTLSFTWRLVMAPPEVIDYVVIHELAHTLEPNHSKRFWERVAAMDPAYKQRMKWLKENGHHLALD